MAPVLVEIDARRRGHAGFRQHAPAQLFAVIGYLRAGDIGIDVKGAVGGGQAVESALGQFLQQ